MWRTSVTLIARSYVGGNRGAVIRGAVVDDHDLDVNSGLVKRIANGLLEESPVVVTGDDDPNARFGRLQIEVIVPLMEVTEFSKGRAGTPTQVSWAPVSFRSTAPMPSTQCGPTTYFLPHGRKPYLGRRNRRPLRHRHSTTSRADGDVIANGVVVR